MKRTNIRHQKKHRNTNLYLFLCMLLAFTACQEKDIDSFDKSSGYIYFDVPYILNSDGTETSFRYDSISYSFALDPEEVTSTTLNVVAKVIGTPADYDRPYNVRIVQETTTATTAEWNPDIVNNRSIKAGELTDTIRIEVKRTPELTERWMQVFLQMVPNENFAIGYGNLEKVKVSFSDILAEPEWWSAWAGQFGPFYPEVYRKWIEFYELGADPNTHPDNGEPLYWDNMPASPSNYIEWYPVLALYLTQLKLYFEENDIYPNGDTSLPPIKLP